MDSSPVAVISGRMVAAMSGMREASSVNTTSVLLREVRESIEEAFGMLWSTKLISITEIRVRAVKLGDVVLSNLIGVIWVLGGWLFLLTWESPFVQISILVKVFFIDVAVHEIFSKFSRFRWWSWLFFFVVSVVWRRMFIFSFFKVHVS